MDEIEKLRMKLESFPSPSTYNRLAELYRLSNDLENAILISKKCIKEFPRTGQSYVVLAGIYIRQNKKEDAMALLHDCVKQDKRCVNAFKMLADLCVESKDKSSAISCLEKVLVLRPKDEQTASRIEEIKSMDLGESISVSVENKHETKTIDMTFVPLSMTTHQEEASEPSSLPSSSTVGESSDRKKTVMPFQQEEKEQEVVNSNDVLSLLADESGVKNVFVVDNSGRIVLSSGESERADLLAALSQDVTMAAYSVMEDMRQKSLFSWSIILEDQKYLVFSKDKTTTVFVVAEANIKTALIELRVKQVFLQLESKGR